MTTSLPARIGGLYGKLSALLDHGQAALLLVIRLYWGWQFFLAGKGKLLNLERTAGFFADLGIPAPGLNAAAAGATEAFGGLLLLAGLGARLASAALVGTMLVAYATAHRAELLGVFSNPDGFFGAPPFLFLYAAALVLVFGPGKLSADALIAARFGGGKPKDGAA
jgi:putative oxidoreductase